MCRIIRDKILNHLVSCGKLDSTTHVSYCDHRSMSRCSRNRPVRH
jgi:hypothetical protein